MLILFQALIYRVYYIEWSKLKRNRAIDTVIHAASPPNEQHMDFRFKRSFVSY